MRTRGAMLLLALPWLAAADKLTLYTIASRAYMSTDLSAMSGPVFDLQGLADFFNLGGAGCRKDPPKADDVVGSFIVEVNGNVERSVACPSSTGHRFALAAQHECYTGDAFDEGCDFRVDSLGVFLNVSSLAPCQWGSCLTGMVTRAFEATALDICRDVHGDGFDENTCEKCTSKSDQVLQGPWYGDDGSGWTCNKQDPPPPSGRWLPTSAMCKCASG